MARLRNCPNDGAAIPVVGEYRRSRYWPSGVKQDVVIAYAWCRWCAELFAYLQNESGGGRLLATFGVDPNSVRYVPQTTADGTDESRWAHEGVVSVQLPQRVQS